MYARFTLASVAMALLWILPSSMIYGLEYDCSFQSNLDVSANNDGSFIFRHSIHPELQTINVQLEYTGVGWVGISFSKTTTMVPNVAIIGLPDDNTVTKYGLNGYVVNSVTSLSSDTLTDSSIKYNSTTGSTILSFTRPLSVTDETTVATGTNTVLFAYGSTNTLDRHAYRVAKTVTLNACIEAGSTAAPVNAPAPVAAAPVPAPVAAPTTTSTGGDNQVIDLGNGRIERLLSFPDSAVSLSIITDSTAQTFTASMVYAGIAWVSFAISDDEFMPNSDAVMAFPTTEGNSEGVPEKYDIGDGRSQSVVTLVTDATRQQSLTDATYKQNTTHTVMTFTKPLVDGNEIPIVIDGVNYFLYAVGRDNNFGMHSKRGGFSLDLGAKAIGEVSTASDNKSLWKVHGILMAISWSILVPLAVGTALLRNFLPLPTGMWFQIHRILNTLAVVFTIAGFGIAVHIINQEQGSAAKHFSTYQHHKMGLVIFIFALLQAISGIFRPHLPKTAEPVSTPEGETIEDGQPAKSTSNNATDVPVKKSPQRIAFEIQHKLLGTVTMILGWFNVDSGIGLYNVRFDGPDLVAVPWAVTGGIVLITLIFFTYDCFTRRNAE
jgi:DOMON domain/Eukaryotic cytochrome b561